VEIVVQVWGPLSWWEYKTLTVQECFVSNQCYLDVQLSCHFVVLLIKYFKEFCPHLPVPLHLTGSDSCEIFFSKVGGMQGMERAYDFHELVGCASTVNKLAAIEYGENGLKFDRAHNKQHNIWAELHPLEPGQEPVNLADYSDLASDADFVSALKEGLKAAQSMLNSLNMAPSTHAKSETWFQQPWLLEAADPKHWSYIPPTKPVSRDDGDAEVLRDSLVEAAEEDESSDGSYNGGLNLKDELVDDGLDPVAIAEDECWVVISEMLDSIEERPPNCKPGIPNTIPAVIHSKLSILNTC
jgi:hypothetical protein